MIDLLVSDLEGPMFYLATRDTCCTFSQCTMSFPACREKRLFCAVSFPYTQLLMFLKNHLF